jgi:hypothetical protein
VRLFATALLVATFALWCGVVADARGHSGGHHSGGGGHHYAGGHHSGGGGHHYAGGHRSGGGGHHYAGGHHSGGGGHHYRVGQHYEGGSRHDVGGNNHYANRQRGPIARAPWYAKFDPNSRVRHGRIHRSAEARQQFELATGHRHGWPGHVVDHKIPLACGGADAPSNMQWQTVAEAKAKDKWERNGCRGSRSGRR